jgi:hypothetical protein
VHCCASGGDYLTMNCCPVEPAGAVVPCSVGDVVSELPELLVVLVNGGVDDLTMNCCPVDPAGAVVPCSVGDVVSELPELLVVLLNGGSVDCLMMNFCPVELVGVVVGELGKLVLVLLTIKLRKGLSVFSEPPFCPVGF